MGQLRQFWIRSAGLIAWRKTQRQARLMSRFAATERGSSYDMLCALENTEYPELRQKYLHHALDEARHARLFRERALALGVDREEAALIDVGYLQNSGIIGGETLFERLGEIRFLAFVYDAEQRGLEHFLIYLHSDLTDQETKKALKSITKDEHFHRSYSYAALQKYAPEESAKLIRSIQINRYKEAWMRFARIVGTVVSGLWLRILFFLFVLPFRIFARKDSIGWQTPSEISDLAQAKQQF